MFSSTLYHVLGFLTILLLCNGAATLAQREVLPPQNPEFLWLANAFAEQETAISDVGKENIPGERFVDGRITAIRSDMIIVDIGNPEPLYVPLKPALDKGMVFHVGDLIVVTMNDHNAIVDYHHAGVESRHRVIYGQLLEPLPVGQDKAIVRTTDGEQSYPIASRARGKLGAMPVNADLIFLMDETGQLVDAQLASENAIYQSSLNNKSARLTGINQRVNAIYKHSAQGKHEISVLVPPGNKEQIFHFRPPLAIVQQLKENQSIVLLLDKEHYVIDIATSDPPPQEFRGTQKDR